MKLLIGRKVGMTQLFDEKGTVTGVTVIEAGPNFVTQVKTAETDGYTAIQLGFGEVPEKKFKALSRGELGHLGKLKANDKHPKRRDLPPEVPALRHLKEARVKEVSYAVGDKVSVDIFTKDEFVDVTGTMKGRGFAGAIKRHRFHRQKATHGASDRERAPGSVGAGTTPGRVVKGHKGPGHYGNVIRTEVHLKVMLVDPERNLLAVRGSVPGANGSLVYIKEAGKQ